MFTILHRQRKAVAVFLAILFANQLFTPSYVYALTAGPSQPEVQSFQPAGTSDMVDLFSGDFSYNIPLFELPGPNGGYPFNLSYQSGVGMDSEASWVGLGWSLNPGAINRQMRGLPDEFKGDPIYTKMAIEPSVTVGLGLGVNLEVFGAAPEIGTVGLGVTQNNQTGMGYSIDASLGFKGTASASGMTGGIGLDLSLNSKEGVNINPSLSLGGKMGEVGLGAGYNSRQGLSSLSFSHAMSMAKLVKSSAMPAKLKIGSVHSSAALSFAHPGYTPQVSMPMRNLSISAQFKPGASWWGIFVNGYIRGFYSEQWLHNNKKRVRSDAYGYLHYQDATSAGDVMDVNREKEGIVTKVSPNLAIPTLTYDIYSVTGQGIGAMYRPVRNDVGVVRDPEASSISVGGSVGVDAAPAASHVGINLSVNHSESVSGGWGNRNDIGARVSFQQKNLNDLYEPWHFKVHGEQVGEPVAAYNALGGDDAVRVKLTGSNLTPSASTTLENKSWSQQVPNPGSQYRDRKPRGQMIQTITNEALASGSQEMISYFKIKYLDRSGTEQTYSRAGLPGHHLAAFTALTPAGLRYNYGLPAYNTLQEQVTFSAKKQTGQTSKVNVGNAGQNDPYYDHSDTEKFLKKVALPPYAHAYLLTSIIGPDYVDVTGDGVTADDLGYWVKFTYQQQSGGASLYQWRDPFSKAHYQEGWKTDPRDDKGSYTYGEKELWYLARAETKSHIATFTVQEREDGRGVAAKLQDANNTGQPVYALQEVRLFTRSAGTTYPIKVVKFQYDYSLCPGVYNSNTGKGKLTLKRVWFEYGASQRGQLNPYIFTYHAKNPAYDQHAYDRWGNYKPYPVGDYLHNIDFPYVNQDPAGKDALDQQVAAWSLQEIRLPSGATITVDYESDDYAYVQHLQAMQMTALVDPYTTASQVSMSASYALRDGNLKIRFPLKRPISGTLSSGLQRQEVLKYIDQRRKQLYFKIKINLRRAGEGYEEYVSGYADIDMSSTMGLEQDASGNYAYGYFYVVADDGRHPFSKRAWQHIRTNQPALANSGRRLKQTNSVGERVNQIKSLGNVFTQVRQMFEGFYNFCADKDWGREVVGGKSWVRLMVPDKVKYGGGLRVRQITMKDHWAEDEEGIYGQLYEYTLEEDGETISSGVAAYEPLVGGDENPLRCAKKYVQSVPLRADNNLFFEYPINETHYPGPGVGYRKVTVTSLASAALAGKALQHITLSDGLSLFPQGEGISYGTTGMTVHEFYTAKDFPVLTDETEKANKPYKLSVPIPFLGNVSVSKLAASQGYSIVTNDMHGKQKQMSTYRQTKDGAFEETPMAWKRYHYLAKPRVYEQQKVQQLAALFADNNDGTMRVASAADINNSAVTKLTLGQESDFFLDMRSHQDISWEGGARVNTDIVYIPLIFVVIPIPVPTAWPSISRSESQLKTVVTNKVIYKSGILESVEAYDGGSLVKTQNLKWDKLTGAVVLTEVNNDFDDPLYAYSIPAYTQYQGMGAAYQNVGVSFVLNGIQEITDRPYHYRFTTTLSSGILTPGDELMFYSGSEGLTDPAAVAVYLGEEDNKLLFYTQAVLGYTEYKAMVVRSGYRNQLMASAGSITALQDPSVPGTPVTHRKTFSIPRTN